MVTCAAAPSDVSAAASRARYGKGGVLLPAAPASDGEEIEYESSDEGSDDEGAAEAAAVLRLRGGAPPRSGSSAAREPLATAGRSAAAGAAPAPAEPAAASAAGGSIAGDAAAMAHPAPTQAGYSLDLLRLAAAIGAPSPEAPERARRTPVIVRTSPGLASRQRAFAAQIGAASPARVEQPQRNSHTEFASRIGTASPVQVGGRKIPRLIERHTQTGGTDGNGTGDGSANGGGGFSWERSDAPADLRELNGNNAFRGSLPRVGDKSRQAWVVDVMERYALVVASLTRVGGTAARPLPGDFVVEAVNATVPPIPQEHRKQWIEKIKRWVASPQARNNIKGQAAMSYRENLSQRGRWHRGDTADAHFPEMEKELMTKFDAASAKGKKLTSMWICANARHIARRLYPATHGKHQAALRFKASPSWLIQGLATRHFLGVRRRTNFKHKGLREMLPKYHRFFNWMKRVYLPVRDKDDVPIIPGHPEYPELSHEQQKYGRFPPWCRSNVDQIPGLFGGGMTKTWARRGGRRVWIKSPNSDADGKRGYTIQLHIPGARRPGAAAVQLPVKLTLIMPSEAKVDADGNPDTSSLNHKRKRPSKGGLIAAGLTEEECYDPRVEVMFQRTAYADANFTERWGEKVLIPSTKRARTSPTEKNSLMTDNLAGQKEKHGKFRRMCKAAGIATYCPPGGGTQDVQPIDRGAGVFLCDHVARAHLLYMEADEDNADLFDGGAGAGGGEAADRRILVTKWFGDAADALCAKLKYSNLEVGDIKRVDLMAERDGVLPDTIEDYFDKAGANICIDGSNDGRIDFEGYSELKLPPMAELLAKASSAALFGLTQTAYDAAMALPSSTTYLGDTRARVWKPDTQLMVLATADNRSAAVKAYEEEEALALEDLTADPTDPENKREARRGKLAAIAARAGHFEQARMLGTGELMVHTTTAARDPIFVAPARGRAAGGRAAGGRAAGRASARGMGRVQRSGRAQGASQSRGRSRSRGRGRTRAPAAASTAGSAAGGSAAGGSVAGGSAAAAAAAAESSSGSRSRGRGRGQSRAGATRGAGAAAPAATSTAGSAAGGSAAGGSAAAAAAAAESSSGSESDDEDDDRLLGDWLVSAMSSTSHGDPGEAAAATLTEQLALLDETEADCPLVAGYGRTALASTKLLKGKRIALAFGLEDAEGADPDSLLADWFVGTVTHVFASEAQQRTAGGVRAGKVNVAVRYRDCIDPGVFYHMLTPGSYGKMEVDGWVVLK